MNMDGVVPPIAVLQQRIDILDVESELKCSNGCPEVFEAFRSHPTWYCDSGPNVYEGGNWVGHVFPGALFIFWASHWLLGLVRQYCDGQRCGKQFYSRACYRFLWFPDRWPMEAVVKAFFPFIAILLELWLAHGHNGYRRLFCSGDKAADVPAELWRTGHFIGNHVNNWQHAAMYPGFVVSGIVDLVGLAIELPAGCQQVFLALSFLNEAVLFGLHGKHEPMDILVHKVLTYSCIACAVLPAMEAVWLNNPLLTAGRVAATYLHGAWFLAAARMMYEDHTAWDTGSNKDVAPVLYAAILFISLIIGILALIAAAFLVGLVVYRLLPSKGNVDMQGAWERPDNETRVLNR